MPTWPRNLTDGERKVAGAKAILRESADGLHLVGPDRDEAIAPQQGYVGGYRRVLIECLARLNAGEPPPITAEDCARAVTLIHDAYRVARFQSGQN